MEVEYLLRDLPLLAVNFRLWMETSLEQYSITLDMSLGINCKIVQWIRSTDWGPYPVVVENIYSS